MVVSSDQIDMNAGFGSSSMTISYVTRRGSNRFSGRLYEGFRAEFLDATNWGSTVKPEYHRNDFGGSARRPYPQEQGVFLCQHVRVGRTGRHREEAELPDRRREAGRFHLRQRRSGESLQYLCGAQHVERHVVPCIDLTDQSADGGAHRGGGRLSAECRQPGSHSSSRPIRICERGSGSATIRTAPTTRRDPGRFQSFGTLAPERGDQPDETGFPPFQPRFGGGMAAPRRAGATMRPRRSGCRPSCHPTWSTSSGAGGCTRPSGLALTVPTTTVPSQNRLQLRGLHRHLLCRELSLSAQLQRVQHHDLDEGLSFVEVRRQLVSRSEQSWDSEEGFTIIGLGLARAMRRGTF